MQYMPTFSFQIIDPAPAMRKTMIGLLQHLKAKWRNSEAYYTMKLMLVGLANHGKTTLMHRLDEDYEYDTNLSTTGKKQRATKEL